MLENELQVYRFQTSSMEVGLGFFHIFKTFPAFLLFGFENEGSRSFSGQVSLYFISLMSSGLAAAFSLSGKMQTNFCSDMLQY